VYGDYNSIVGALIAISANLLATYHTPLPGSASIFEITSLTFCHRYRVLIDGKEHWLLGFCGFILLPLMHETNSAAVIPSKPAATKLTRLMEVACTALITTSAGNIALK